MEITLSDKKNHLIFTEREFNDYGVATSSKVGSLPIDRARAEKALAWAKTQKWEFSAEPINGFHEMTNVSEAAAPTEDSTVGENEVVQ